LTVDSGQLIVIQLAVPFDYAQGPRSRTATCGCSEETVNTFMGQYIINCLVAQASCLCSILGCNKIFYSSFDWAEPKSAFICVHRSTERSRSLRL